MLVKLATKLGLPDEAGPLDILTAAVKRFKADKKPAKKIVFKGEPTLAGAYAAQY